MVGWHHWLNGHEFEQALGVGDGPGSLACCSPWGHNESEMTELNWLSWHNAGLSCLNLHNTMKGLHGKYGNFKCKLMWRHDIQDFSVLHKDTENGLIVEGLCHEKIVVIFWVKKKSKLQINMDYFISILENYILLYKHRKKSINCNFL